MSSAGDSASDAISMGVDVASPSHQNTCSLENIGDPTGDVSSHQQPSHLLHSQQSELTSVNSLENNTAACLSHMLDHSSQPQTQHSQQLNLGDHVDQVLLGSPHNCEQTHASTITVTQQQPPMGHQAQLSSTTQQPQAHHLNGNNQASPSSVAATTVASAQQMSSPSPQQPQQQSTTATSVTAVSTGMASSMQTPISAVATTDGNQQHQPQHAHVSQHSVQQQQQTQTLQQQRQQQHDPAHSDALAQSISTSTTAVTTGGVGVLGASGIVCPSTVVTSGGAVAASTGGAVHHHHHFHHGCAHVRLAHSCLGHQHQHNNGSGSNGPLSGNCAQGGGNGELVGISCVNNQQQSTATAATVGGSLQLTEQTTGTVASATQQQQSTMVQQTAQPQQQQQAMPQTGVTAQQGNLLAAPLQTLLKKRADGTVTISVEQLNQLNSHLVSNSPLLSHPSAKAAATLISATAFSGTGGAANTATGTTLTSGPTHHAGGATASSPMQVSVNGLAAPTAIPSAGGTGPGNVLSQHQIHHHHHHHHHHLHHPTTVSIQQQSTAGSSSVSSLTTTASATTTTPAASPLLSPSGTAVQLLQQANGNLTLLSPNNSHLHLRSVGMSDVQGALLSPTGLAGVPGVVASQLVNKVSPPRPKTILPKMSALPVPAGAAGGTGGTAATAATATGQVKTTTVPLTKANLLAAAAAASGPSSLLTSPTMAQALAQNPLAATLNVQQQHTAAGLSVPQLLGLALPQQSSGNNAPCEVYEVPGGTIIIPKKGVVGATTSTPGGVAAALNPQAGGLSYLGSVPLLGQLGQLAVGSQPWPLAAPPAPTIQLIQTPTGQQAVLLNPFLPTPLIYPQLAVPQPNLLLQPQGGTTLAQLVAAGQQGARAGLVNTLGAQGALQMLNPALIQKLQQQQHTTAQHKSSPTGQLAAGTTKISVTTASTTVIWFGLVKF